jgi:glycosyltransferase involved in cell wall biosynthesis
MARIYLDARAVLGPSGLNRYCEGLIPELARQAPFHQFIVVRLERAGARAFSAAPNVREVAVPGVTGTLPLLLSRARLARVFRLNGLPDLLHSIFHVVPFGIRRSRAGPRRIVVTLHDLIWIDYARQVEPSIVHAWWRRRLGSTAIEHALRVADHVLCNSEATRRSAERWLPPGRATVVYHGVGQEFFAAQTDDPSDPHPPYVAAFGIAKPYKNVPCLVHAFAAIAAERPTLRLVLLGGDGGAAGDIARLGLGGRVTVAAPVADRQMRALVAGAAAFVVPSLVEGFGLPVLEAMALGAPVIVSDTPALREIAGGAAVTFDPLQPSSLAAALRSVLDDPALSARLREQGAAHARQFEWRRTAEQTLAVYDLLLQRPPSFTAAATSPITDA